MRKKAINVCKLGSNKKVTKKEICLYHFFQGRNEEESN